MAARSASVLSPFHPLPALLRRTPLVHAAAALLNLLPSPLSPPSPLPAPPDVAGGGAPLLPLPLDEGRAARLGARARLGPRDPSWRRGDDRRGGRQGDGGSGAGAGAGGPRGRRAVAARAVTGRRAVRSLASARLFMKILLILLSWLVPLSGPPLTMQVSSVPPIIRTKQPPPLFCPTIVLSSHLVSALIITGRRRRCQSIMERHIE